MPITEEALIRVTLDSSDLFNKFPQMQRMFDSMDRQAQRLGVNLGRAFDHASVRMDQHGRVIGGSVTSIGKAADGSAQTITASFGRANTALDRFGQRVIGIASGILVWQAFRTVTQTIYEMRDAQAALSAEVIRYGLVTGQSLEDARESYLQLQAVTTAQGIMPAQAAPIIQTATRFGGTPQGQAQFAQAAGIFSNLFGTNPQQTAEIFAAALRQQDLALEDSMKVLDQFIAVYKGSIGSPLEIADALTEAPNIMQKFNLEYDETLGLMAEVSGASSETANVVAGSMTRIGDSISRLEGDKALDFARAFADMGIQVQSATGEFLDPISMLVNIAQTFDTLEPEMQSKVFELLGLLKPTYQQVGRALMQALADGQVGNLAVIEGAGKQAGEAWAESYQGAVNRALALQQEVFQQAGPVGGLLSRVMTEAFQFIGEPQAAVGFNEAILRLENAAAGRGTLAGQIGVRDALVQRLMGASSEQELWQIAGDINRELADKWNQSFYEGDIFQRFGTRISSFFTGVEVREAMLTPEEVKAVVDEWKKLNDEIDKTGTFVERAAHSMAAIIKGAVQLPEPELPTAPDTEVQYNRLRDLFLQRPIQQTLPTNAIDLTNLSMQEYNQLLADSETRFNAILSLQIEQMRLAGLTEEQIKKQVDAIREAADETFVLVELEGQRLEYVRGASAAYLQEEARRRARAEKDTGSDFAFRRLKDIDPSQFGQLQALTMMYNQMLTRLGSPEEEKNINLLLGEENVFKQLTGRMTALQLALEDLTKVEKAQLSGTWNLPAGATALVPISSLDIQRWNAQGGGGMSPEALMAFLQQFAGMMGGRAGAGAVEEPLEGRGRRRLPVVVSPEREEAIRTDREMHDEQLRRRRAMRTDRPSPFRGEGDPHDALMQRREARAQQAIENVVNIAPMPLKASFAATINVMMSGQIVARTLFNAMYNELLRLSRSGPGNSSQRSVGNVR